MTTAHHHAVARPFRLTLARHEDSGRVLRTCGYRGDCECGWKGPVRNEWADARADSRAHNEACPKRGLYAV